MTIRDDSDKSPLGGRSVCRSASPPSLTQVLCSTEAHSRGIFPRQQARRNRAKGRRVEDMQSVACNLHCTNDMKQASGLGGRPAPSGPTSLMELAENGVRAGLAWSLCDKWPWFFWSSPLVLPHSQLQPNRPAGESLSRLPFPAACGRGRCRACGAPRLCRGIAEASRPARCLGLARKVFIASANQPARLLRLNPPESTRKGTRVRHPAGPRSAHNSGLGIWTRRETNGNQSVLP